MPFTIELEKDLSLRHLVLAVVIVRKLPVNVPSGLPDLVISMMFQTLLPDSLRRATANLKWAFLLTGVNLSLTLLALLPVVLWLDTVNGRSLFGERLLKPTLDIEWLVVALRIGKSAFPIRLAVASGLVWLVGALVATLLAGGIIASFVPQEVPRAFWADCRRYFLPLLVAGMATLALQALAGLVLVVGGTWLYASVTEGQTTPWRSDLMQWLWLGSGLLIFWSIRLVMDYVRLALVVHGPRRSWSGQIKAGLGLLVRYPVAAIGFYALTTGLWLVVVGGLTWLASSVAPLTWTTTAFLCLLGQLLVCLRYWVNLVFIAGGCRLLETMP
ncbi:MAG: hypothetical protein SNJ62_03705 [Chloracidobacterium sp.]